MSRYIDADKLSEMIEARGKTLVEGKEAFYYIANWLHKLPSADVAEVKHGEWITDEDGFVTCSECGEEHTWDDFRPPFCDMCGARMDGGDAE